jgi:phosphoribosylformylglycinamidine synthase
VIYAQIGKSQLLPEVRIMNRLEIKICILRVAGTNCDLETKRSIEELGAQAKILHGNEIGKSYNLMDYNALIIPGGFSYGDYVRAGAIWAKSILSHSKKEIMNFVEENRPILGICNGFQVLVEAGLLPGFKGVSSYPQAVLAPNSPPGYNCRWIHIKHENKGNCIFTRMIPKGKVLSIPVAHSEGRFLFAKEKEQAHLKELYENDQLVFRYCKEGGAYADNEYPCNPNGSFHDIAGICSPEGTTFGLMPHPERGFHGWQKPDWTAQENVLQYGDGKLIFEGLIRYLIKKF